jgi:hypothetical protein
MPSLGYFKCRALPSAPGSVASARGVIAPARAELEGRVGGNGSGRPEQAVAPMLGPVRVVLPNVGVGRL